MSFFDEKVLQIDATSAVIRNLTDSKCCRSLNRSVASLAALTFRRILNQNISSFKKSYLLERQTMSQFEMKICRLCGCEKDANDIVCEISNVEAEDSSGTITLKQQISTFFNVRMNGDKKLPQSVCQLCRMQIEVSLAFADNMKKVQTKLVLQKVGLMRLWTFTIINLPFDFKANASEGKNRAGHSRHIFSYTGKLELGFIHSKSSTDFHFPESELQESTRRIVCKKFGQAFS